MDGLEFAARIVATGTFGGVIGGAVEGTGVRAGIGAGIGAGLDEIARAVGDIRYVDNLPGRRKTVLLRDYGLVEFTFNRAESGADTDAWVCCNFLVQLHRLESGESLRAEWRDVHGVDLPAQITWGDLRAQIAREYQLPDPIERVQAGARYLRYPASNATVLILDDSSDQETAPDNRSVYSISVHPE